MTHRLVVILGTGLVILGLSPGTALARSARKRSRPPMVVPLMPEPLVSEPVTVPRPNSLVAVKASNPYFNASAGASVTRREVRLASREPLAPAPTHPGLSFLSPDLSPSADLSADSNRAIAAQDQRPLSPWGYGLELGSLFNRSDINSDVLGLQMLYGGRAFARFPILNHYFFVKGSLGYFRRSNSEGGVSVAQHVFELGGSVLYAPSPAHSTIVLFGLAQRVDGLVSNISLLGTSASTPLGFRYRLGPQAEVSSSLNRHLNFVADIDATFTTTVPVHPFLGLSVGLMFK